MRQLVLFVLSAGAVLLASSSRGSVGWTCAHSTECDASRHELCVANTLTSSLGTCQQLRVLP